MKKEVLFVCLGNICRSPAAEGIALALAPEFPVVGTIDSAGTGGWHVGSPPDRRMVEAAKKRGYDLSPLRARQVSLDDFSRFDWIVAMDRSNYDDLTAMTPSGSRARVVEIGEWLRGFDHVPDPYYGGADGFDRVLDLLEGGVRSLFLEIQTGTAG